MSRSPCIACGLLVAFVALAQTPPQRPPDPALPPDEDVTAATPKEYVFNPVQSKREVEVGIQYFHKGNYKAAANRFLEATKWNEGNADAWLRLADAQEKQKNAKAEREALEKYLELMPDAKNAAEIKKRLAKIKG
jgi:tetratricopeptide (TPR) repeat protein